MTMKAHSLKSLYLELAENFSRNWEKLQGELRDEVYF